MAKDQGLKINEWGVFRVKGDKETRIAGATEEEVYATLDLPVFPPETARRAARVRLGRRGRAAGADHAGRHPRRPAHAHHGHRRQRARSTKWSPPPRPAACRTSPSPTTRSASAWPAASTPSGCGAVEGDRPDPQAAAKGFTLLKGIECDILEKGGMDLPDDVLAEADWVIASVHYGQKQPRAADHRADPRRAREPARLDHRPSHRPADQPPRAVRGRSRRRAWPPPRSTASCWS